MDDKTTEVKIYDIYSKLFKRFASIEKDVETAVDNALRKKDVAKKNAVFSKSLLFSIGVENEVRMKLDGWKNFLRFNVFFVPKDKSEKQKLVANVPLNRTVVYSLIKQLKTLPDRKEGYEFAITSMVPKWVDNKMTDEKDLAGTVIVGRKKDKAGDLFNYIKIVNKYDKAYAFRLGLTPFLRIKVNDKILSPTEASDEWAVGYSALLSDTLHLFPETLMDKVWIPVNPK